MKRALLLLFLSVSAFAQHGQVAQKLAERRTMHAPVDFAPLKVNANPSDLRFQEAVNGATIAALDPAVLASLVAGKHEVIRLKIPYGQSMVEMLLYRTEVATADFEVLTDKGKIAAPEPGVFYRGTIENQPGSLAAFSFFRDGMSGIVSSETLQNLNVVKRHLAGTSDYIIYSDAQLRVPNDFECHMDERAMTVEPQSEQGILTNRCVTMYLEIDHDVYLANGASTEATTNWMLAVFNNVQTLYANDDINIAIKSLYIWTEEDPYQGSGTTSADYLYQFASVRPYFNGDLGQLIGIDEGGLGGVAITIDGLCSANNHSYSDVAFEYATVPTFSWTVMVITHEFGHLMGSPHTHGCYWNGNNTAIDGCAPTANPAYAEGNCAIGPIPAQGTIMSYCHLLSNGISLANGFGPQPAARIQQRVNAGSCLSTDCVNTCISLVRDVTASAITNASATVTWEDDNPTASWEVGLATYPFTAYTWSTVEGTPTKIFSSLAPNTYYKAIVRPICAGLTSQSRGTVFATGGDFCAGLPFVDSGGAAGAYTNMEDWVRIVKPLQAGAKAKVVFSMLDIELDYDYLYIHDGEGLDAPLLTPDGLTGWFAFPDTFESTDASGALTFHFVSDLYTTGQGWTAQLSCTNLGVDGNDFSDFSYTPNPTGGIVHLKSGKAIESVAVYGLDGRLLLERAPSATDAAIDLSGYAAGVYVFKAKSGGGGISFRIVKQ